MTTIRRAGTSSVAVLSGLLVIHVLTLSYSPAWAERTGLDYWNYLQARNQVSTCLDERGRLEELGRNREEEYATLNLVAEQLGTGKLSLAAAVDIAGPMLQGRTGLETVALSATKRSGSRELIARHLIARVRRIQGHDANVWNSTLVRLEREYSTLD